MFQHKNAYPVILVPGVGGYGEDTALGKVFPYFGRTASSAQKIITDMGLDCHTPSFGVLSGVWDRACELYAQIVGGTVDYGAAHSAKHGHARYGKTYRTPLVPNWGTLDNDGKIVKISLIAYGFGAPVARLFLELMNHGSAAEREASTDGSLSGLFVGGYNNIIHCLVSLAGINEGITTVQALEDRVGGATKALVKGAVLAEEATLRTQYVDPYYAKHGLTVTQHGFSVHYDSESQEKNPLKKVIFDEEAIDRYLSKTEDNIFYEMSIPGMTMLNNCLSLQENTYYLSFAGSVTQKLFDKVTLPKLSAGVLAPVSLLISTYENYYTDKPIVTPSYHENDGLINTGSSLPPVNEAATMFKNTGRCKPGVWYQIPVENKNHLSFTGFGIRPDVYRNGVYDIIKTVCNLETV